MNSTLNSVLKALRIVPGSVTKQPPVHKIFNENQTAGILPSGLAEITLETVALHDDFKDCWIVIYDRVYDVTKFLRSHPGGEDVLMDYAGRDATLAFHGTGHSRDAIEQLSDFIIGELPYKERIFRKKNAKVVLKGIPE